jgi:hypothetical protein
MGRYIKKHKRLGSLGPTEEKGGAALWVGYELDGIDRDLSEYGLIRVDDDDAHGVTTFLRVEPEKLGVKR